MNKPLIIAHRGVTEKKSHENTINAFKEAIDKSLDAIELDIHRTMDGVYVVHHDPEINYKPISTLYFDEILTLQSDYIVPSFDEVISLCKGRIYLDIELKEEGYEIDFIRFILEHLSYKEFCIRTFFDKSLKKIKKYDNNIRTGLLLGVGKAKYGFLTRLSELFPLFRIINTKCDFVSPHFKLIRFGYILRMHIINKQVITWTVNDINIITKHIKQKVDGIVTDKPTLVEEVIKKTNH